MLHAVNLERESSDQEVGPQFTPSSPALPPQWPTFLQRHISESFYNPHPKQHRLLETQCLKHIDLGGTLSAPMGDYLLKPVVTEVFPYVPTLAIY